MRFDRVKIKSKFSDFYKKDLHRVFTKAVSDDFEVLLAFVEGDDDWSDIRQLANFLAQIMHETAFTFKPIAEKRDRKGTDLYNRQAKYWNWKGRGYIQLTWEDNYKKFEEILNQPLTTDPDIALRPSVAYEIAKIGMQEGIFTGKKLSDYINESKCEYKNARKIVNWLDKAEEIAGYSRKIESVLKESVVEEVKMESHIEQIAPIPPNAMSAPQQAPVVIPPVVANKPTGWQHWKTTATGIWASLGISASTVMSYAGGAFQDPTIKKVALLVAIGGVGVAVVFGVIYMIVRTILIVNREKMAHEKTLKELEIRANPNLYNVEVEKK